MDIANIGTSKIYHYAEMNAMTLEYVILFAFGSIF